MLTRVVGNEMVSRQTQNEFKLQAQFYILEIFQMWCLSFVFIFYDGNAPIPNHLSTAAVKISKNWCILNTTPSVTNLKYGLLTLHTKSILQRTLYPAGRNSQQFRQLLLSGDWGISIYNKHPNKNIHGEIDRVAPIQPFEIQKTKFQWMDRL